MANQPFDPTEPDAPCPLTTAIAALGGKWNLICLYWIADEPRHFGALRRLMPGLSQKVLSETLRQLERDGLITRTPRGDTVDHVDYALSDYGREVVPIIDAMRRWGSNHIAARVRPAD